MNDKHLKHLTDEFKFPILEELPEDDARKKIGANAGSQVIMLISHLTMIGGSQEVCELARHMWNLISSNTMPMLIGDIDAPSIRVVKSPEGEFCTLLIPNTFEEMDLTIATCSLLFWGSIALDFYNGKMTNELFDQVYDRAQAYQVQFMLYLQANTSWKPDDFETDLIARFPQGLRTEGIVTYLSKPTPYIPLHEVPAEA